MQEFLWGAATSSHQIDGHNENSDWWQWEAAGNVEGGVRSGAATDHWKRFKSDLRLAADLGLTTYRFSIEWARLEPEEGRWNESAFEWYSEMIAECENLGLLPMATLHHFTSPQWFAAQGGFTSPQASEKFARYATQVAQRLGSRIPIWCTFNEPMVLVFGTYIARIMPPAIFAPKLVGAACNGILKSHVLAYDILHSSKLAPREGRWKDRPLEVGIAHNIVDFRADRRWHPMENLLVYVFRKFFNRSWLDAVTGKKQRFAVPFLVPRSRPVSEALGRRTVDYIGANYYTKGYVQWRPKSAGEGTSKDMPIGVSFARRRETASDLGWAIHPEGLARTLHFVARYQLPIYVTENGIADAKDVLRPEYLVSHLREIARAIKKGIDVRGYYHWSLLDNFEWIKGFWPRFGLYQVDYETFERRATRSALLYKKLIEAHRATPENPSRSPDSRYLGGHGL